MEKKWIAIGIMVAVIMFSTIEISNSEQNLIASAASNRTVSISGAVTNEVWDFYAIGHLSKGAAVTVKVDLPVGLGDCIYVRVVNRDSDFTDSQPRWNPVYKGTGYGVSRESKKYQFIVPSSGDYMLQIKGRGYSNTKYNGSATIVD